MGEIFPKDEEGFPTAGPSAPASGGSGHRDPGAADARPLQREA
jgi:hypothetical protein